MHAMSDFYFYGRRVATIFQSLPSLGKFEDDMIRRDVLQLSGLLAGGVKESRNDNSTGDL